jgi:hypothetical protein
MQAIGQANENATGSVEAMGLPSSVAGLNCHFLMASRAAAANKLRTSNLLELSRCWFCQQNDADENCADEVKLQGNFKRAGRPVYWEETGVRIPRCFRCKGISRFENVGMLCGGTVGTLLLLLISVALIEAVFMAQSDNPDWGWGRMLAGAALVGIIMFGLLFTPFRAWP